MLGSMTAGGAAAARIIAQFNRFPFQHTVDMQ
jgi:hypothetical protein